MISRSFLRFIIILTCLCTTSVALAQSVVVERLEASVNSSLILLSDVLKFRQTLALRQQLDPLFAGTSIASHGVRATDNEIVEFLIDEKLIAQAFPISDTDVEQEINSIQANNKIDRAQLRSALKEQGFNFDEYFELIRTSAAKRNLIDRDIRTKVSISDDDVKNYYYNHNTKGSAIPTAFHVKIITVSGKNYKSPSAARDVANRALKEIKGGEAFEEVAKRISDDPSAAGGGDLGELTDDQMSPVIKDQLKKMKIGQVSDVIGNSKNGFLILKLVDMKSSETDHLGKQKEQIRSQLAASEYQHQIALWLERQRQVAFIHRAGEPAVSGLPTK